MAASTKSMRYANACLVIRKNEELIIAFQYKSKEKKGSVLWLVK